jgi:hypothetical protein
MNQKTATRNLMLEQMLESVEMPCRGADNGCTAVVAFGVLADHEMSCQFCSEKCTLCSTNLAGLKDAKRHMEVCPCKEVECQACGVKVKRFDLFDHLWKQHSGGDLWRGVPRPECFSSENGNMSTMAATLVEEAPWNFVGHKACMVQLSLPGDQRADIGILVDKVLPRRHRRWHISFRVAYVRSDVAVDLSNFVLGVVVMTSKQGISDATSDFEHIYPATGMSVTSHSCSLPLVPYNDKHAPMASGAVFVVATPMGKPATGKWTSTHTMVVRLHLSKLARERATKIRRVASDGEHEVFAPASNAGDFWQCKAGDEIPFVKYMHDACIMSSRGVVGMGQDEDGAEGEAGEEGVDV